MRTAVASLLHGLPGAEAAHLERGPPCGGLKPGLVPPVRRPSFAYINSATKSGGPSRTITYRPPAGRRIDLDIRLALYPETSGAAGPPAAPLVSLAGQLVQVPGLQTPPASDLIPAVIPPLGRPDVV